MKRLVSVVLLLVLCLSLQGCGSIKKAERQVDRLLSFIDSGNIEKLSLKIFYMDQIVFINPPQKVEDLLSNSLVREIEVGGQELSEHIESLRLLKQANLKKPKEESRLDAKIYYYFEEDDEKLLEVALWGGFGTEHTVFVGGVEVVDPDGTFWEIIEPFLPEE